jgi:hypothetical protein
VFVTVLKNMESHMEAPEFLHDLTDDEAQSIQGGATNPSPQRTDVGVGGLEIPITGSPGGGIGSRILATFLPNPLNLTPNGFFRLIFKLPDGSVAQPLFRLR